MNAALPVGLLTLPLLSSPLAYFVGRFSGRRHGLAQFVALVVLLVAWAMFVAMAGQLAAGETPQFEYGMIAFRLDGLAMYMAALALGLSTLAVFFARQMFQARAGSEKYYAALLALTGAMIGLAGARDLFNLWVWFETMIAASYLLVVIFHDEALNLEAGFKYVVQSAMGSGLVVFGIALILLDTGTLNLDLIAQAAPHSAMAAIGSALCFIGFGVKVAIVPMHTWLPDVYTQSPSVSSAVLAGAVSKAGLVGLLRVTAALSAAIPWADLFMLFGAASILAGNLLAFRQRDVKRLLAYSSMGHLGYVMLGIGFGLHAGQTAGVYGGLFHALNHSVMKGLAFFSIGAALYLLSRPVGREHGLRLDDLAGMARRCPLLALALTLALFSLAGIPPLAGFMSKWQIFAAGLAANSPWVTALVVFAALNSVLSLGYYLPVVNALYREGASEGQTRLPLPRLMAIPLVVLSFLIVLLGLWPDAVRWLVAPASVLGG